MRLALTDISSKMLGFSGEMLLCLMDAEEMLGCLKEIDGCQRAMFLFPMEMLGSSKEMLLFPGEMLGSSKEVLGYKRGATWMLERCTLVPWGDA